MMRIVLSSCVCYGDQPALQKTKRDEPVLAVIEALVWDSDRVPAEYLLDVNEVNAMFADVGPSLGLIPLQLHPSDCSANL